MTEENSLQSRAEENTTEAFGDIAQKLLNELEGDEDLETYRNEYGNLVKALQKSKDNERGILMKCVEFKAVTVSNSVKLDTAQKLVGDDKNTAIILKKEVNDTWRRADIARGKEADTRETIENLEHEIKTLTELLRQGAMGQMFNLDDLLKTSDELTQERDDLLTEVVNIRDNLTNATTTQQELEVLQEKAMENILQLQQEMQVAQDEVSRETLRKEKAESDLEQLHSELDAKQSKIKVLTKQNQKSKDRQQKLEKHLQEQRVLTEKVAMELEKLKTKNAKLQHEKEYTAESVEQLTLENQQRASELKIKEDEADEIREEISKIELMRETSQRKLHQMEDQKMEMEQQREMMKKQMAALERELESTQKQMKIDKKAIRELMRERDILKTNVIKAANETKRQLNVGKLHEQSKKSLEQEIRNYKEEAQKQHKKISQLEKERDRYANEVNEITEKTHHLTEYSRLRETQIYEYRKKIADVEKRVKQQQLLYEAVRSDNTLHNKHLNEIQADITEVKTQLKMMQCDADQLKEEISGKESALEKETAEFLEVEEENEELKEELQNMKQQAQDTKQLIDHQEEEQIKLLKIIDDTDAERQRQRKQLNQVIRERDILGRLLVDRNAKVELLYKKLKAQRSLMIKGEMQYNQMLENIRLLKLEIKKRGQEKFIVAKKVANVEDLRREMNHIQKELLKQQTMCRALEEDIEILKNIHRWRRLEVSDPSTFQLIQKIHFLQKCQIIKNKELEEKELLLQEKQKFYVKLRHIVARQPGPEVTEQLQLYQQTLREKTKELKTLQSDLSTCLVHKNEHKKMIERLDHELQIVKKKYFAQKRKEDQSREKVRNIGTISALQIPSAPSPWVLQLLETVLLVPLNEQREPIFLKNKPKETFQ
ncbi:cilia- and flagella-associated protein 58-like [Megalops cyprinoides]|uniref:cilia- and flagella-associated protein 58-like n=1 Tax=Megalops cyprinoides TaxID=118141 RepID=UPI0018641260|nr:cilia- and flagella-associated protein 58-like [Megalops cyprinoides]